MEKGFSGIAGQLMNRLSNNAIRGMGNMNMGANSGSSSEIVEVSHAEYDVDRWKRADEPQTIVQQVRFSYEEEQEKKKLKNRIKKMFAKIETQMGKLGKRDKGIKKKEVAKGGYEEMATVKGGTIDMRPKQSVIESIRKEHAGSFLNVGFEDPPEYGDGPAWICGEFFRENPLNSAILAIDDLSLGSLSLNQVQSRPRLGEDNPRHLDSPEQSATQINRMVPMDSACMKAFKEQRENRKYDVKILP